MEDTRKYCGNASVEIHEHPESGWQVVSTERRYDEPEAFEIRSSRIESYYSARAQAREQVYDYAASGYYVTKNFDGVAA